MKQIFLLNLIIFPTCFANQKNTRRVKISTDKPWEIFYAHILFNLAYISWNSLSFLYIVCSWSSHSPVQSNIPSLSWTFIQGKRLSAFIIAMESATAPPLSSFPLPSHCFLLLISLLASWSTHTYMHMHAHMHTHMHTKARTPSVVCLILISTRISLSITFIHWKRPEIISLYCAMNMHHGVFNEHRDLFHFFNDVHVPSISMLRRTYGRAYMLLLYWFQQQVVLLCHMTVLALASPKLSILISKHSQMVQ